VSVQYSKRKHSKEQAPSQQQETNGTTLSIDEMARAETTKKQLLYKQRERERMCSPASLPWNVQYVAEHGSSAFCAALTEANARHSTFSAHFNQRMFV
jgi:hypothetical protein